MHQTPMKQQLFQSLIWQSINILLYPSTYLTLLQSCVPEEPSHSPNAAQDNVIKAKLCCELQPFPHTRGATLLLVESVIMFLQKL
jgi:hypothetical protein